MAVIKTLRYRLYPTKRQEELLNNQLAICCEVYNAALQERREAWQRQRKSISYIDQTLQITEVRKVREDVAAVAATALRSALRRVDLAFCAFFRRVKNGEKPGYPRFRSARRYDSLTFRKIGHGLAPSKIRLPNLGWVHVKFHRPVIGTIKTVTVKREAGRWFVLLCVEYDPEPLPFNPEMVGVDVGIASFATLSTGDVIMNPRWFQAAQKQFRRLQRRVARRKRGSNRRRHAALLLQRFHNHIRDQRRDFHHKESRKIVNQNGLIAVEDLNIEGLARSVLAKSIRDAGWSNFLFQLAYKAEDAGRVFVKVDPRGTSQTCICGAEVRKPLSERVHSCSACGLVADRDHISAQLILARLAPSGVNVGEVMPCVA